MPVEPVRHDDLRSCKVIVQRASVVTDERHGVGQIVAGGGGDTDGLVQGVVATDVLPVPEDLSVGGEQRRPVAGAGGLEVDLQALEAVPQVRDPGPWQSRRI